MADMNAGSVTLEVRAVSNKLAADMAAAKAKLATSAASIEKSLNLTDVIRGMNGMSAMLPGVGGQFASVASNVAGLGGSLGATALAASAAAAAILATAAAAGALGKASIEAAASRQDLLLSFEILLKSKDAAKELVGQMQRLADTTPLETTGIAEASRLLLAMRFDVKDIIPMVTKMGDAMVVSGKGTEGLMRLALVLGQIKSAGRLLGQDVLQLNQLGLNPRAAIARDMGISENEVRKRMEAGTIPAAQALKSIFKDISENANGAMKRLSEGWNGQMSTLRDGWNRLLVTIGTPIVDRLSPMLETASGTLAKVTTDIARFGAVFEGIMYNSIVRWLAKAAVAITSFTTGVTQLKLAMQALKAAGEKLGLDSPDRSAEDAEIDKRLKILDERKAERQRKKDLVGQTALANSGASEMLAIQQRLQTAIANLRTNDEKQWVEDQKASIDTVYQKTVDRINQIKANQATTGLSTVSEDQFLAMEMQAKTLADKQKDSIDTQLQAQKDAVKAQKDQAKEVYDAIKQRARDSAEAVVDGLRKQYEAHQSYAQKVMAIYTNMANASTATRGRMVVSNVSNVGQRLAPDWSKHQDALTQAGETLLASQYMSKGGSSQGVGQIVEELKGVKRYLYQLLEQEKNTRIQAVLS